MKLQTIIRRLFNKPCMSVSNDSSDERIESLRFTVPALRVGVLEYAPGQLTTNNKKLDGKTVKLYYPPESVSDAKFLKSLETAPVVVGGHNSTTNEQNKKIDGWAHSVNYDLAAKAAMISGVVKGNKEVAYIKSNLGMNDFGASAFVDIFNMEIKSGITDDGQEYNAIAKDLRATHVALAPHVRDPQNKIRVTNAVCVNTGGEMVVENASMKKVEVYYENGSVRKLSIEEGFGEDSIKDLFQPGKTGMSGSGEYSKIKSVKILNQSEGAENAMEIDAASLVRNISAGVKNALKEATAKNAMPRLQGIYKDLKEAEERVRRDRTNHDYDGYSVDIEKHGDEYHIIVTKK